jgi:hypothetical protein
MKPFFPAATAAAAAAAVIRRCNPIIINLISKTFFPRLDGGDEEAKIAQGDNQTSVFHIVSPCNLS